MAKNEPFMPGLGLYLGTSPLALSRNALQDGVNFRIKHRAVVGGLLGWTSFSDGDTFPLNGAVTLIDNFFPQGATEHLIFGTQTDLYRYDASTDEVVFLTPREETGTASASGTTVTGSGTAFDTNGVEIGDMISFGASGETDPQATWYEIASVDSDTQLTLTSSAGTVGSGAYTIRRLFSGTVENGWNTAVFVNDGDSGDDLWFATNGVDWVITWNGTDDQVTLQDGLGFTCTALRTFKNMMIYGNITDAGNSKFSSVINSNVGLPLRAGNAGTGLSEEFVVNDTTDEIQTMRRFGDNLVIYSTRNVVVVEFVGDPFVFAFRSITETYGVRGKAVADFGDFHRFIGQDALYEFDGASLRAIDDHVWRDLIRTMDPARIKRVWAHFDEENGDLLWVTPLVGDDDSGDVNGQSEYAYVAHYLESMPPNVGMPYSKREFPFTATGFYERAGGVTWADLTETWETMDFQWNDRYFGAEFPQTIAGDKDGNVWVLNETSTKNGLAMQSHVRFGRWASGSGREANLLRRVYPLVKENPAGQSALFVRVYGANHAGQEPPLLDTGAFKMTLQEGADFVSVFRAKKYFELEFYVEGGSWTLYGYLTDISPGGRR